MDDAGFPTPTDTKEPHPVLQITALNFAIRTEVVAETKLVDAGYRGQIIMGKDPLGNPAQCVVIYTCSEVYPDLATAEREALREFVGRFTNAIR